MKNLEFQWLILKIDETAAKKRSACLLCWFATQGTTGRQITLQRSFCRSRYFTVLLYYARTWRISSFTGLYWKLTKWRQKYGQQDFSVDSPPKIRLEGEFTLQQFFRRSQYFTVPWYYTRTWRISSFSGWYWKLTKLRQKNGQHAFPVDSPLQVRLEVG